MFKKIDIFFTILIIKLLLYINNKNLLICLENSFLSNKINKKIFNYYLSRCKEKNFSTSNFINRFIEEGFFKVKREVFFSIVFSLEKELDELQIRRIEKLLASYCDLSETIDAIKKYVIFSRKRIFISLLAEYKNDVWYKNKVDGLANEFQDLKKLLFFY